MSTVEIPVERNFSLVQAEALKPKRGSANALVSTFASVIVPTLVHTACTGG